MKTSGENIFVSGRSMSLVFTMVCFPLTKKQIKVRNTIQLIFLNLGFLHFEFIWNRYSQFPDYDVKFRHPNTHAIMTFSRRLKPAKY